MEKTSASDNGFYPEFCYAASKHNEVFQNFKRNQIYRQILEHISAELGKEYLIKILNNPNLKISVEQWKSFLINDSVGNPITATYNFNNLSMTCSPTTLRYIKVLSDIVSLFDIERIKSISEIGIGYAGQCRILMQFLPIVTYNLIDLPEVLALSEKFLNEVKLLPNIRGGGDKVL